MSEELGKIEKPPVEDYKKGRKLYFIPLVFSGKEAPDDYVARFNKYWEQTKLHLAELETKLGKAVKIYHELVPVKGDEGVKVIRELNDYSYQIAKERLDEGAQAEAVEDSALLTEFMDWSRCLAIGLQNQQVFTKIYESYTAAGKKRNEQIAGQIDETLQPEEAGILFMREGHQVQFPDDIQVFYVAPPALDELKRWLRDYQDKIQSDQPV